MCAEYSIYARCWDALKKWCVCTCQCFLLFWFCVCCGTCDETCARLCLCLLRPQRDVADDTSRPISRPTPPRFFLLDIRCNGGLISQRRSFWTLSRRRRRTWSTWNSAWLTLGAFFVARARGGVIYPCISITPNNIILSTQYDLPFQRFEQNRVQHM